MINKLTLMTILALAASIHLSAQRAYIAGDEVQYFVEDATYTDSPDGRIIPDIRSGIKPFKYYWRGPEGFESEDSIITGLLPGVYAVDIRDAHCGHLQDTIEVRSINSTHVKANSFAIETVRPNPFVQRIGVIIQSTGEQTIFLEVLTSNGARILYQKAEIGEGKTEIMLDLGDAPTGVYVLQCCNQINCKLTERILKVR